MNLEAKKIYTLDFGDMEGDIDYNNFFILVDAMIGDLHKFIGDLKVYRYTRNLKIEISEIACRVLRDRYKGTSIRLMTYYEEIDVLNLTTLNLFQDNGIVSYGYMFKGNKYIIFAHNFENDIEVIASADINSYSDYLKTGHWKIKRKEKLKEAGYRCQLCSKKDTVLNVHHNNYDNLGNENLNDLIVLCEECHNKFHDKL